jgi:hypothetical protein
MMKTMKLNDMETKEIEICEEMLKLRDWLNENGIGWEDVSDSIISRTRFVVNGYFFSVVHGFDTYGGINIFGKDSGLLECMTGSGVVGCLTAEDVIEMVKEKQQ